MAQTQYRINLAAKDFSFLAAAWGRSIIVKQFDQNFSRQIVSTTDPDKDIGIPQIYYCHNVMPSSGGFMSVSLQNRVAAIGTSANPFFAILPYINQSATSRQGYLGFVASGSSYLVYDLSLFGDSTWSLIATVQSTNSPASSATPTTGIVNGTSYFYFPYTGCFSYDGVTWTAVTLTGLVASTIRGITSAFGYLLAWSTSSLAWSSTVSATDFTPSLITGAGGGGVQDLKGTIVHCAHHIYGLICYSETNAVSAAYSGNPRYPFNFREIVGSGGLNDQYNVGIDPDTGNQLAWTTKGLQLLSVNQATAMFPDLVNFIGGSRFEDFNEAALQLVEIDVAAGSLAKNVTIISGRYMVISYGLTTNFTHALIYDAAMKRWGKIKINHVRAFEFAFLPIPSEARTSIGFVDNTGAIYELDFSYKTVGDGVMILGKYQHTRNRLLTMQEIDVENIFDTNACSVYDLMTFDGKTFQPPVKLTPRANSNVPSPIYNCRLTALNHSLLFVGAFNLSSIILNYTPNGRR